MSMWIEAGWAVRWSGVEAGVLIVEVLPHPSPLPPGRGDVAER